MSGGDGELIARFLAGDSEAIALIDGWISAASSSFRGRFGDTWEDLFQEVRLELFRLLGAAKFRGESSLKTYVWRVVSHTCLDELRRRRRWRWTDVDQLPESLHAQEAKAVAKLERNDDRKLMLEVLERVPEECRRLWRHLLQGWSYQRMSEEVGVSAGALRVRVLRCRRKATDVREKLLGESP